MVEVIYQSVNEPNSDAKGFLNPPTSDSTNTTDSVSPDSGGQGPATSPINTRSSRKTNFVRSARRSPVIGALRYGMSGNTCSHHIRSQSVRTSRRPNRLEIPEFRSRVSSMPLEANKYNPRLIDEEEFYRLRSFSITAKGVVNRGDSLRSRRSRSNTSVASSTNSRHSGGAGELREALCLSATNSCASSHSGGAGQDFVKYRVAILGASGVGKTAITTQFMTSEYMNTYDASLDDDYGEKSVSVLLDGEESEMVFIDHPSSEMSVENFVSTYEPHGYVVVYSITDRNSFQRAEDILSYLWKGDYMRSKAVILAGNKTDLVRSRVVSTEGQKIYD
ncbi:GTP binding protein overexpressed in skeletal muscle, variant 2 [Chamberlinius hualienensis]